VAACGPIWLAYGAALNEGRGLFAGDREFGQWVETMCFDNLSKQPNEHEQVAAMWGAANRDDFANARAAGNRRTVRGWPSGGVLTGLALAGVAAGDGHRGRAGAMIRGDADSGCGHTDERCGHSADMSVTSQTPPWRLPRI